MRAILAPLALIGAVLLAGCTATGDDQVPPDGVESSSVVTVDGTFRPRLSWPNLDADDYVVGIVSESGAAWSWHGDATSVIVGDVPEVDWQGPGFALEGSAELWFAAFDAEGGELYSETTVLSPR